MQTTASGEAITLFSSFGVLGLAGIAYLGRQVVASKDHELADVTAQCNGYRKLVITLSSAIEQTANQIRALKGLPPLPRHVPVIPAYVPGSRRQQEEAEYERLLERANAAITAFSEAQALEPVGEIAATMREDDEDRGQVDEPGAAGESSGRVLWQRAADDGGPSS